MFKQWVAKIDNLILQGRIQSWYSDAVDPLRQSSIGSGLGYKITSHYRKDPSNELARLCDTYGSDKGQLRALGHPYSWPSHTYTDYYSRLFGHSRQGVLKVFECGLGTNNPEIPSSMGVDGQPGASLRVWKDYFPNALVWGGDIDRESLFQEERISTHYINQLDAGSIREFWKAVAVTDFDFILDDGLHTFEAGSNLFTHSIEHLANSGIYVIEDVSLPDLAKYKEFFQDTEFLVDYVLLHRPKLGLGDNNLVVVRKPSNTWGNLP